MLEYNPIPTDKSQFKEGTQVPRIKRNRDKKYKNVLKEEYKKSLTATNKNLKLLDDTFLFNKIHLKNY